MPLIVTPRQLVQRAEFYHQLSQLTASGIGLLQALDIQRRNPPAASFRTPLSLLLAQLEQGSTFTHAVRSLGQWIPAFDSALVEAGEKSGRLPNCFKLLATYYQDRAKLVRSMIGYLAYPVFIFHFAVLIFPVSWLQKLVLEGAVIGFILQKLLVLVPLYSVVFVLTYFSQGNRGETSRSTLERVLHVVPMLGTARRELALARLSAALEALISAGVTIIEAWELAAAASGSPALVRVVQAAKPRLLNGETPSEMINGSREFPQAFASLYHTGEVSGQLDDTLLRLNQLYQEDGARKLKTFLLGAAGAVIFSVMLLIAWQIISFWLGYFQQINNVIAE